MFPSAELLNEEYNEGLLDVDGLLPYLKLGNLTQDQFSRITSKKPSNPIF